MSGPVNKTLVCKAGNQVLSFTSLNHKGQNIDGTRIIYSMSSSSREGNGRQVDIYDGLILLKYLWNLRKVFVDNYII